jgi:hypothetical protein
MRDRVTELAEAVAKLPRYLDGSGAAMVFGPNRGIPDVHPLINAAVREIAEARGYEPLHLMINELPPGVVVPKHRDWLLPTTTQPSRPCVERWHLPVQTNPDAMFWDEDRGLQHAPLGVWFGPVPYWILHTVWNLGTTPRVHIVVDLDTPSIGAYRD